MLVGLSGRRRSKSELTIPKIASATTASLQGRITAGPWQTMVWDATGTSQHATFRTVQPRESFATMHIGKYCLFADSFIDVQSEKTPESDNGGGRRLLATLAELL
jgi:hypothetical protein